MFTLVEAQVNLEFEYYGQNDGTTTPDVPLTGDPAVDQPVLTSAGYLSGRIMALAFSATAGRGTVIVPCDGATKVPYGTLINGPGNYAESIGPSGSKKAPIVRAMPKFKVPAQSFVASPTTPYAVGEPLFCGTGANVGHWTADSNGQQTGICTHVPSAAEPWLGVAQSF